MKRLKVTNQGEQTRYRLGIGFAPGVTKEIEVYNHSEYLTIKAVRDFKVEVLENTNEYKPGEATGQPQDNEIDISELTVPEVLKAVTEGKLEANEAIAKEIIGKNRPTLLEKLERLKEGE